MYGTEGWIRGRGSRVEGVWGSEEAMAGCSGADWPAQDAVAWLDLVERRDFRKPSVTGFTGDERDGFQEIGVRPGLCAVQPSFGPWEQGRFPGHGSPASADCAMACQVSLLSSGGGAWGQIVTRAFEVGVSLPKGRGACGLISLRGVSQWREMLLTCLEDN